MIVKLLTEPHLEFLSLKGGCTGTCQNVKLLEISCRGSLVLDCGDPGDPSGVNNKDSFYSGTAEITCNIGYTGGGTITCLEDGSWNTTTAIPCTLVGELFSIHLIRSGDKAF